jgi:hypothetical protein
MTSPSLPTIFQQCKPRPEVLAGELPDAIFAADLWDVIVGKAHSDYQLPERFFAGTHPTENLKLLLKDIADRLCGAESATSVYRLETGFGGGKSHSLIATVHLARHGERISHLLGDYNLGRFPKPEQVRVAAFVGEESDPLSGNEHIVEGQRVKTYTPWGQIALLAGGLSGYERIKDNDLEGVAPSRGVLEEALGPGPVLILIDELVLYMARGFAMQEDSPRGRVNSQWATFLPTLFSISTRRPAMAVILTLPTEQDANRRLTGQLKQYIPTVLDTVHDMEMTTARQARNLTPTQSYERAAVLGRRLFESVDNSSAQEIADAYVRYLEAQRTSGVAIESRAFELGYGEQLRSGYPFHPELVRLFAERLADIPEFNATRGALRLVSRTIRSVWARREALEDVYLLHPHHIDLTRSDLRDEILARLGRRAFERGLDADVVRSEGDTHARLVEAGWPWPAASESSLVAFLHSLPDGSRGTTPAEAALAVGRPGIDLAYVARGLEETERRAWYMRKEGDHFLFRTRASINKRFQERLAQLQPGEDREELDNWVLSLYSGFSSFQVIPFPQDHTAIPDNSEKVRLAVIHYDQECGAVAGGERLSFTKALFTKTGSSASPRRYRNNLVFLLAEATKITGMKEAVRALIGWERVEKDILDEQKTFAMSSNTDVNNLKSLAGRGATGVPPEFLALESDFNEVREKLGLQELNVRTKILEGYRVLAFPRGGQADLDDLFASRETATMLECFRVDFGERPDSLKAKQRRQAVAEVPILQCLRVNSKLVPEATPANPMVLAPGAVRKPPLWKQGERRISTDEAWDRIRREPELPMLLKQTELLPTLKAGLLVEPDALWIYYNQAEKKVFNRNNALGLTAVLSPSHFLYDPAAALQDKIVPVTMVSPQEIWDFLWPRSGAVQEATTQSIILMEAAKGSPHFPVLPELLVLWQGLREGARESRWVLYFPGRRLVIGPLELEEWPSNPSFNQDTELWTYSEAVEKGIYPRKKFVRPPEEITPQLVKNRCWPSQADQVGSEVIELAARAIWPDLSRPRFEKLLSQGLTEAVWAVWFQGAAEIFYLKEDTPHPPVPVQPTVVLVEPDSQLARELDPLRPGKGPQPVEAAGTPREVFTKLWEQLGVFKNVLIREISITVTDRNSLDNTLVATWGDRPTSAVTHASLHADGEREVQTRKEEIHLAYEGRFEEIRSLLAPVWAFQRQGDLVTTITVQLLFEPALPLSDGELETYRTAIMNANQGTLQARVVPIRPRRPGGA